MKTTLLSRVVFSRFMMWNAILVAGCFYIFSFDKGAFKKDGASKGLIGSLHMPKLKLGTDLQGGTYLVLGVEVEKAVENRLASESKSLDELFEKKDFKALPKKKEVQKTSITMEFADEETAKTCYNFIKKEVSVLKADQSGLTITATLSPVEEQRIRSGSVEQGVNVLNNRLNNFGVSGLIVQRHGERQIVVQLPGVDDPERVKAVITKTAHLEFKIAEKMAYSKEALLDDFEGELPPDKMILPGKASSGKDDEEAGMWYLVSAVADLTGDHIVDARMSHDEYGKVKVAFQLDSVGARIFKDLTGNNIGRSLGIVIDNVMYSAPTIQAVISSSGEITNIKGIEEAQDLALVLRSGSLVAPLKFEQESRVGASLGQDSIYRGIFSCIIALLILCVFSVFYYKIPGIFAILALIYNLFLILIFLSYFEATLTLPGIAGMVLTIGMAIDASILIYEKVKEELRDGVPLRKAVNEGFGGAMGVILDSNITTFLTGLVLFKFGGPAIKGFAVTIMAGIVATIISGVYFLKSTFDFILDVFSPKSMKF